MFQRPWVRIPAQYTVWTFFTYVFVVKFVMCVFKDKNKWKRGHVWPIFFKKTEGLDLQNDNNNVVLRSLFSNQRHLFFQDILEDVHDSISTSGPSLTSGKETGSASSASSSPKKVRFSNDQKNLIASKRSILPEAQYRMWSFISYPDTQILYAVRYTVVWTLL